MISKELLSEIFMYKVTQIHNIDAENNIHFNGGNEARYPYFLIKPITINIYELANKCKEWAFKQGYELFSRILSNDHQPVGNCVVYRVEADPEESLCITNADTEPEAIFKACEWVIKQ